VREIGRKEIGVWKRKRKEMIVKGTGDRKAGGEEEGARAWAKRMGKRKKEAKRKG
jgi:hypothetical protein